MIILHTITRGSGGGTMRALEQSISYEREQGHEVWIASGNPHNADVNHLYVRYLKREINFLADMLSFLELRKIVAKINPDMIHSHESKAGVLTRLLCYIRKKPVYVHTVHMATFHSKSNSMSQIIFSWIERMMAKKTDFLVFVSPALRTIFESRNILPAKSALVIRSRVNIEKFRERRDLRSHDHRIFTDQLGLSESVKIILVVGLLEPRKRPQLILKELANVIAEDHSIFLVFLGEGQLRQHLERRAAELNISYKTRFLGFKSDIEKYVSGSDVIVIGSTFEGFPQIALQASAAGTPIVATNLEEYLGSSIFRIISSDESMAEVVLEVLTSSNSHLSTENPEIEHWNTKVIDGEHKILLDWVSECLRR